MLKVKILPEVMTYCIVKQCIHLCVRVRACNAPALCFTDYTDSKVDASVSASLAQVLVQWGIRYTRTLLNRLTDVALALTQMHKWIHCFMKFHKSLNGGVLDIY